MNSSGYYLDLNSFSLSKLKKNITNIRLLPSQQVLREDLEGRFACLEEHGIRNLRQLQIALKTKSKVRSFSEETGIPVDFLTILRREVNSYEPKPISIRDFPGVKPEVIQKLETIGIKNTLQLFPIILTPEKRNDLAEKQDIEINDILDLTKLTDIARLKWVGPKFARLMVETGYDTVEKIAQADGDTLYQAILRTNEEKQIYKGNLGSEDITSWIENVVRDVPRVIEY